MQTERQGPIGRFKDLFQMAPPGVRQGFEEDCIQKNVSRFSILPYFNIITQVACVFIYLYVYPTLFPEKPRLDPLFFLAFTAVYILENVIMAVLLNRRKRVPATRESLRVSARLVDVAILFYVLLEATQVAFELEISGNIYRYLATFFVVSFFPIISRKKKFFFMLLYTIISELALYYLWAGRTVDVFSFPVIIAVLFFVCLIATNIYYGSICRNYRLRMDLVETNRKLVALNAELERLSVTDELTGIANRRALNEYAEARWKSALRSGEDLSMLMIDVDNFKAYNDTYGHQEGDGCLRLVADCIKRFFNRATDMTARYGGEEFAVLLPYTRLDSCIEMAEAVRECVEAMGIENGENGVVTISIGVAAVKPRLDQRYEILFKLADDALYKAKESGRNRTYVAHDDQIYPATAE